MLASSGEITAPCGVPTVAGLTCPSSITPTFSHLRIRRTIRRSPIRCSTKRINQSWLTVSKEAADVGVQYPVHLRARDPDRQRVREPSAHGLDPWGIMLAAPRPEPVREPEEVFLVDRVQHLDHRSLDDLVLQRRDAQRPLPSIRFRNVPPPQACPCEGRGQCAVTPPVDTPVQVPEFLLKPRPVLLPRRPIHSGGRLSLQPEVGLPQQIDVDMVEQRGEPLLLVQFCRCPYTVQSGGHACPARGPARVGLARVPLGPCPLFKPGAGSWLPALHRRSPVRVRAVLRYYDRIRLLVAVHHRLGRHAFPMRTRRPRPVVSHEISRFPRKERPHMPGSRTARDRRAARSHATRHVAFPCLD